MPIALVMESPIQGKLSVNLSAVVVPFGSARRDCALSFGGGIQEVGDESLLETVRELEWNVSGWVQIPRSQDGPLAAFRVVAA